MLRQVLLPLCALATCAVQAQDYPNRPIRMVVPFASGGTADVIGRPLVQKMSATLGQNLVLDNRGGAGGSIAATILWKSPPDGYTLMLASSGAITVLPSFSKVSYDSVNDFTAVGQMVLSQLLLTVNPKVPVQRVKELLALARVTPGALSYGSSGGTGYLAGELFSRLGQVRMTHVPYRGGDPLTVDLLSGQIHLAFPGLSGMVPHVRAGRLRALAVSGLKRSVALPELPTVSDEGLPGFEATTFWGILAPAKTPPPIVRKLNQAMVDAVKQPDLAHHYISQGNDPVGGSPESFAKLIREELDKWRKLVVTAGIKVD
jgi:tripartite-type tricarboxylate transporter receptor subunit TctC